MRPLKRVNLRTWSRYNQVYMGVAFQAVDEKKTAVPHQYSFTTIWRVHSAHHSRVGRNLSS